MSGPVVFSFVIALVWVIRISYHLGRIADACEASNRAMGIGVPAPVEQDDAPTAPGEA